MKKRRCSAAMGLFYLYAHDAQCEQAFDDTWRNLCVVVHLADERPDFPIRELEDAVAEQRFVWAELRKCGKTVCMRHASKGLIYMSAMNRTRIFAAFALAVTLAFTAGL